MRITKRAVIVVLMVVFLMLARGWLGNRWGMDWHTRAVVGCALAGIIATLVIWNRKWWA